MESSIFSEIVSTEWLNENLTDQSLKVVQVSFANDDSEFKKEHIQDSVWWYWNQFFGMKLIGLFLRQKIWLGV